MSSGPAAAVASPPEAAIDATRDAAHLPLLGLARYQRALFAAKHAGCARLHLVVGGVESLREALQAELDADRRLADVEVRVHAEASWREAGRDVPLLDGAALYDAAAVAAILAGRDPSGEGLFRPAEAPEAEHRRALLDALNNPCDGLVDTHFNRHLSRRISRAIVGFGFSPNAITVAAFLIGLAGVMLIAAQDLRLGIVGALLFQLSAAVDCVDGEVARLTYRFSPFGARLDLILDNVAHLALFAAIAWGALPLLGTQLAAASGGAALLGGLVSFLLVYRLTFAGSGPRGRLARLLDRLTNRDFSVLVIAAAVTGRWDVLLLVLAVGVNLFWLFLGLVAWRSRAADA